MEFDRRTILAGGAALALAGCKAAKVAEHPPKVRHSPGLADLEHQSGGRLGAYFLDTASGAAIAHRADELFGMCSTFKLSLGAAILQRADQGKGDLKEVVQYSQADMKPVSPVTTENLAKGGMTVEALARAAQVTSDNTAANLLLKHIGGPQALTAFWRSLGDDVSRLDRYEGELNLVPLGEVRDTTSAQAMALSMSKFLTGDVLSKESKAKLIAWMVHTETGLKRIRAGLPADWRVGDKTGTASDKSFANKYNDLAIIWPKGKPPVIVTAFYEAPGYFDGMRDEDQAVLDKVGQLAAKWAGML